MNNMEKLIQSLREHAQKFPSEKHSCEKTITWIENYWEYAFVRENLEGHITASMFIINPERTKVLLMLHKKFQRWQQFGGHCDGETDTISVALREFHEESGVAYVPNLIGDIFISDVHDIPVDLQWRPRHLHFDLMYIGTIPEDTPFLREEREVDDIQWFEIEGIEKYIESDILVRIEKIKNLKND